VTVHVVKISIFQINTILNILFIKDKNIKQQKVFNMNNTKNHY